MIGEYNLTWVKFFKLMNKSDLGFYNEKIWTWKPRNMSKKYPIMWLIVNDLQGAILLLAQSGI
jgi:hypothetical protein